MSEPRVLVETPPAADERRWYGEAGSQFVDFRRPPGAARGLAIMIHGGFWRARYDLVHAGHLCAAVAAAGWACANVEYRRVGELGGGWTGTFDDVKRAVAFAREWYGDSARTVVLGHSAGGHLALWVAAEIRDLACAIGLAPVASLHQTLSGNAVGELLGDSADSKPDAVDRPQKTMACPTGLKERFAYADPARETPVPRVLIHGDADDIVPVSLTRSYAAPARIIEIAGADHFALIDPLDAAFGVVLEELGCQH